MNCCYNYALKWSNMQAISIFMPMFSGLRNRQRWYKRFEGKFYLQFSTPTQKSALRHSAGNDNKDLHREKISHLVVCHTLWLCNLPCCNIHARITDYFFMRCTSTEQTLCKLHTPDKVPLICFQRYSRVPLLYKRISLLSLYILCVQLAVKRTLPPHFL